MNTKSETTGGTLKKYDCLTLHDVHAYGRMRLPMLSEVRAFVSKLAKTNDCFAV